MRMNNKSYENDKGAEREKVWVYLWNEMKREGN